ncbi:centrosomal protein of 95 kDa-like isoform X2 [Cyprinodon tularosa]|uniref:centrosomal protein of 95 kDa-like isoform X2 n=1 Tax=Cyprinodon tularosa TaxID=77115 RepID=UPI0018E2861C|nr:centrosomal protein of 95 kDa-like isoform X2 [Cyprinodon tularosa]
MGTQEGERNWVDVANNLLSRCNVNLRVGVLSDCNAHVFITLYEKILGETVPDFIKSPSSLEDEVHNVQSVIDSLSLDYLQISLSHITGENVVRGDKESIKNLLEIFDGLLEYLNEESQNGDELNDPQSGDEADKNKKPSKEPQQEETAVSPGAENTEEAGSACGLDGFGGSDQIFTNKQEEEPAVPPETSDSVTGPVDNGRAPHSQQIYSAIPLQPPNQSDTPHSVPDVAPQSPSCPLTAAPLIQGPSEEETPEPAQAENANMVTESLTNGVLSPTPSSSPAESEESLSSPQRSETEMEGETLEPSNGGPRRVLFRTQPDVLFLTLQDEGAAATPSPPDTEEDEEDLSYTQRFRERGRSHRKQTDIRRTVPESSKESLANRRRRNKEAEEELHHISEKLSLRLEELDLMLKRVLGESDESSETREADRQSGCSDGIMEGQRTLRQRIGSPDLQSTEQTRSASPSPPRDPSSLHGQLEEAIAEALSLDDGRQTNLQVTDPLKQGESHFRPPRRNYNQHLENEAYEEELRGYEERERTKLHKARLNAQKAEQEYREAILRDVSPSSRPSPSKTKTQRKKTRTAQPVAQKSLDGPKKAPSLRIKENELLPLLREELPHLQVSPHALGRMWEQQMQQVDRLRASSSSHSPHHYKLSKQLEEAQRKHDLLVDLVHKDQDHSRRLRDFKERIQQQKSVQNRLREQRQQVARAKKYHNDYHVQHSARLMRARTKEEKMFRQLFEEGLQLQKLRVREQRAYAKEQRLEHQRRHQDQIESLENYYKDQFSLLAEKLAEERQEIQARKKAQEKALLKMKRELRSRMEREIRDLQRIIIQNDEDDYFQDLEVQRLRSRVNMASFQYNTSYLH